MYHGFSQANVDTLKLKYILRLKIEDVEGKAILTFDVVWQLLWPHGAGSVSLLIYITAV